MVAPSLDVAVAVMVWIGEASQTVWLPPVTGTEGVDGCSLIVTDVVAAEAQLFALTVKV